MNCTLSSCTSIISSTCLFRAPFGHLTSSSIRTRPDIRRPIRGEERATRSNTSGNSGDQSPAPRAGRVQVSGRVSDMNLLKAIFISNLVTPLKRMSSVAASGRYRRQSTRGHPHRYSKRHRSADASRCVDCGAKVWGAVPKATNPPKIAGEIENPRRISSRGGDRSRVWTISELTTSS